MKRTFRIELPAAADWRAGEYEAENLRALPGGGCVAVGIPAVAQGGAGNFCALLEGGDVLTAGDDFHDLYLNGEPAGSVGAPLLGVLPRGEGEALLLTADGAEWFAAGRCRGAGPSGLGVGFALGEAEMTLTATVAAATLKGTYHRDDDQLLPADCAALLPGARAALEAIQGQARRRGLVAGPCWVAWRLTDAEGRTLAQGAPVRLGALAATATVQFRASREGTEASLTAAGSMSAEARPLLMTLTGSLGEFWAARATRLEVALWSEREEMAGVTGRFASSAGQLVLNLVPHVAETPREGQPDMRQLFAAPFAAGTVTLSPAEGAVEDWAEDSAPLRASTAYAGGTVVAYALSGRPGVMAVASAEDPTRLRAEGRVASGRIFRICAPVGSAGGWNYGRHHLVVFASDGIYAVSVDSRLQTLSSSLLSEEGVGRADAVAVTASGIYVATASGLLLRLKGSKAERVEVPMALAALGWNPRPGELWLLDAEGGVGILDSRGRFARRRGMAPVSFPAPGYAVDAAGNLRDLGRELTLSPAVRWRRRVDDPFAAAGRRRAVWKIDSPRAVVLALSLAADSGGGAQRMLALSLLGPVNAPVAASFIAPARTYLTLEINGTAQTGSRFLAVEYADLL